MPTSGTRDGPGQKKKPQPISQPAAAPYQTEEDPAAVHLYDNGENSAAQCTDLTTISKSKRQTQDVTTANDTPDVNERSNGNVPENSDPKYGKHSRRRRRRRRIPAASPKSNPNGEPTVAKPMQRPMVEPKDPLLGIQEVVQKVGMSRSSIYVQMRLENFPIAIKVSQKSNRWKSSEIDAWIESRPRATGEIGNWRLKRRK